MRKYVLIMTCLVLGLISCNRPLEKPDGLIGEDKLKKMMLDFYVAKQVSGITDGGKINYAELNTAIFQKHGVSPEEYEESLKYYMVNSDTYEQILKSIVDSLSPEKKGEEKTEEFIP